MRVGKSMSVLFPCPSLLARPGPSCRRRPGGQRNRVFGPARNVQDIYNASHVFWHWLLLRVAVSQGTHGAASNGTSRQAGASPTPREYFSDPIALTRDAGPQRPAQC